MKKGGFSLRKWVSNDPDVLATISKELQAIDSKHTINDDQPVKILGIAWLPDVDKFTFTITVNEMEVWTKRKVLSEVAKIFDPLGWLAPTVIISKIFLQELWSHHLSWDEELPDSLAKQWRTFQEQLPVLTNIKIPRCILIPQASDVQVHGFCDSSEKAYCAAIYIRSQDVTLAVTSRLLTSKTRVSPVKPQSLPRLELCSALLLANLLQATLPTLTVPISETFAWSDSKITLAWLKSEPRRWQPFVANRVAQIQELTPNVHWNHVSGLENPADCGTRGIPPTKLEKCDLWFNGPDWLRSEKASGKKDAGTNTSSKDFGSLFLCKDPPTEKDHNLTLISNDFEAMYNVQRFADVVLKLGKHEFPVHKLILRSRSKMFEAMFEHDMLENRQHTVDLVDMEPDTVKDMLRY
ncbi:uncharacterized protein LOC129230249 [Uloborus diversus]|uniref:uncharacterized protein LOC129230249 n=1 Tax=Uloborus diversus TaxID=327109 RepID=UPI0024092D56|nr:uncharacterized protein LOC129230249 [Uloborus diversus]